MGEPAYGGLFVRDLEPLDPRHHVSRSLALPFLALPVSNAEFVSPVDVL